MEYHWNTSRWEKYTCVCRHRGALFGECENIVNLLYGQQHEYHKCSYGDATLTGIQIPSTQYPHFKYKGNVAEQEEQMRNSYSLESLLNVNPKHYQVLFQSCHRLWN